MNTVTVLREKLKQSGFTGKLDKVRKDDLIGEYLTIKYKEWQAMSKPDSGRTESKPENKLTSLQEARAETRKRKHREESADASKPEETNKRAKIPAFLQKKEEEAAAIRA
jgi:hypothetical protein